MMVEGSPNQTTFDIEGGRNISKSLLLDFSVPTWVFQRDAEVRVICEGIVTDYQKVTLLEPVGKNLIDKTIK